MEIICPPDTSTRPFDFTLQKYIALPVDNLFKAWTTELDLWFASPGSFLSKAEPNAAFYFETLHEGKRSPHYGRFLKIEFPDLVELTWVTGPGGTEGNETILTIKLTPVENGTLLNLAHAGFPNEELKSTHENTWPYLLEQLEERRSRPVD